MTQKPRRVGVLLLNMGGPDSLSSVRPFLRNIFSDRMIIRLPLQPVLARAIALGRSRKVVGRYRLIGGKSPIMEQSLGQARALETELNQRCDGGEVSFTCYVGMRYWHPYIEETIRQMIADGMDEIVALPLFPQYSIATTGSCFAEMDKCIARLAPGLKVAKVEGWAEEPGYLDALASSVSKALRELGSPVHEVEVVFSAHALPQKFVDEGDPYPQQVAGTIKGVLHRLGSINWRLTYQSRSGPVKWMQPQTDVTILELAKAGCRKMLVVPVSFVSDHIETLYEIDIVFRQLAMANGVEKFLCTPGLGEHPDLIGGLAAVVLGRLKASSSSGEKAKGISA